MKPITSLAAALFTLAGSAAAQTNTAPQASDGGKAVLVEPRPVAEADDTLNSRVLASTSNGLALSLTIDGSSITLNSVAAARVPMRQARPARIEEGDTVTLTGFSAGRAVASTVVSDAVLNASEGDGLVRLTRRQISAVLVANAPIDTVQVSAPATAASATLDVRSAYTPLCEAAPTHEWCPKRPR